MAQHDSVEEDLLADIEDHSSDSMEIDRNTEEKTSSNRDTHKKDSIIEDPIDGEDQIPPPSLPTASKGYTGGNPPMLQFPLSPISADDKFQLTPDVDHIGITHVMPHYTAWPLTHTATANHDGTYVTFATRLCHWYKTDKCRYGTGSPGGHYTPRNQFNKQIGRTGASLSRFRNYQLCSLHGLDNLEFSVNVFLLEEEQVPLKNYFTSKMLEVYAIVFNFIKRQIRTLSTFKSFQKSNPTEAEELVKQLNAADKFRVGSQSTNERMIKNTSLQLAHLLGVCFMECTSEVLYGFAHCSDGTMYELLEDSPHLVDTQETRTIALSLCEDTISCAITAGCKNKWRSKMDSFVLDDPTDCDEFQYKVHKATQQAKNCAKHILNPESTHVLDENTNERNGVFPLGGYNAPWNASRDTPVTAIDVGLDIHNVDERFPFRNVVVSGNEAARVCTQFNSCKTEDAAYSRNGLENMYHSEPTTSCLPPFYGVFYVNQCRDLADAWNEKSEPLSAPVVQELVAHAIQLKFMLHKGEVTTNYDASALDWDMQNIFQDHASNICTEYIMRRHLKPHVLKYANNLRNAVQEENIVGTTRRETGPLDERLVSTLTDELDEDECSVFLQNIEDTRDEELDVDVEEFQQEEQEGQTDW